MSGCRRYLERSLLARLGFVQPVNVGLYFMGGGIAEAARFGLPGDVELCSRLKWWKQPLSEA